MSKKGLSTLIGFLLFTVGFLSLILQLVGIKLSFLVWIDAFGGAIGLAIRLLMILSGIVITYATRVE